MKYYDYLLALLILVAYFFLHNICIANPPAYADNLIDAMVESENTKLPILVIFTADWCKYCDVLKNDITKNLSVLDNIIICYIDYDQNIELSKEYRVSVLPTCLLIKDKKELKKNTGYQGFNSFKQWLLR